MKRLLPFLMLATIVVANLSCKKQIDQKKEDIIMSAITDGIWIVEFYSEGSTDISSNFANYDFQFFKDGKVTGTKIGVTTNGTWVGNATNYTITSTFTTSSDTLVKMNGVWKLTDSYLDYVEAEKTTTTGTNYLHLRKKL